MTVLNENESLVLIIDFQEKLINAAFNKNIIETKSIIMAKTANILKIPTIVTEQYPKGLGGTIQPVKDSLGINCEYYEKTSFSALDNPIISNAINKLHKKQTVVFGIKTHICVSQTVNALITNGYDVTVISDACGSRAETEHIAGLQRIKENGAHIITTEIALFEWLKDSKHPNFKDIQSLIK